MNIQIRKIHEGVGNSHGFRIFIDRDWPNDLAEDEASLDFWIRDLAPSEELVAWFGSDPRKWPHFKALYFAELDRFGNRIDELFRCARQRDMVLLYDDKPNGYGVAEALKEYLDRRGRRSPQPSA